MILDSFLKHWYTGGARLSGCSVLISDVSIRTGQAIAVALAREGAHVGIFYGEAAFHATAVKRLIEREGGEVSLIPAPVAGDDRWLRAMGHALREMGKLDILVTIPDASASAIASDLADTAAGPSGTLSESHLELIEVFGANTAAGVVVHGIFMNDDPNDLSTSSNAVAGTIRAIDQASTSLRVNAIRIASPELQARFPTGEDEYLAQVAMGCVLLASGEGGSLHGTVLSQDLDALTN